MIKKFFRRLLTKKLSWAQIEQDMAQLKFSCGNDPKKWQDEAREGNQVAIHLMAELNFQKNRATSVEMFEILSDHEYPPAQFNLGLLYLAGKELEKNQKKGFSLIKKSAVPGYAPGFFQLALCYKNAMGTKENPEEYIKNLRIAHALEAPESYCELAEFHSEDNEHKDLNLAYKLHEQSAKLGYIPSYYRLSQFYLNGLGDTKKDMVQAFVWLTLALKDASAKIGQEDQDLTQTEHNFNAIKTLKEFLSEKELNEVPAIVKATEQQIKDAKTKNKRLNML